jgi:hypothetical protein
MIERFARFIPEDLSDISGSVFYSGRSAFGASSPLYILGLNPGGSPENQSDETVAWHTNEVLKKMPSEWSEYQDQAWKGAPPGTHGLQPRILHLLRKLGLDPQRVPASNVVFVRSERESTLGNRFSALAEKCWPFHENVISQLGIKVVLCFGQKAGNWVTKNTGAHQIIGEFVESNSRRWKSRAFSNAEGLVVVVATHPSIVDWTVTDTDPSPLVRRAMEHASRLA